VRQLLALPSWDVDTGIDLDLQTAELRPPGDPGQWLTGQATPDELAEELSISPGPVDQLLRLFVGGEEAGSREQGGKLVLATGHRHFRNTCRRSSRRLIR
jgi:hypothetical protein